MGARVKAYDPIANAACREQRPDLKIRYCDSRLGTGNAIPMPWCWSPSGASSTTWTWPNSPRLMANPILVDGRNFFVPETAHRRRLRLFAASAAASARAPAQRADSAPAAS